MCMVLSVFAYSYIHITTCAACYMLKMPAFASISKLYRRKCQHLPTCALLRPPQHFSLCPIKRKPARERVPSRNNRNVFFIKGDKQTEVGFYLPAQKSIHKLHRCSNSRLRRLAAVQSDAFNTPALLRLIYKNRPSDLLRAVTGFCSLCCCIPVPVLPIP